MVLLFYSMRKFYLFIVFFVSSITATFVRSAAIPFQNSTEIRSTNTCADPTLTETFLMGYTPSGNAHVIQRRFAFVHADTVGGGDWQIQGEIFQAWGSAQEFTVPLYVLFNPTTTDYLYLISTPSENGTPPVASGFVQSGIIGYVYSTQICGSVPLYAVFQDVVGDHWYTTLASERDDLVANGWIDSGIAAYVLSLV